MCIRDRLKEYIRSIPDFPEKGIIFRDVTSVLQDADGNEDWTPYCQETVDLTGEYQTITKEFQMKEDTDLERCV